MKNTNDKTPDFSNIPYHDRLLKGMPLYISQMHARNRERLGRLKNSCESTCNERSNNKNVDHQNKPPS